MSHLILLFPYTKKLESSYNRQTDGSSYPYLQSILFDDNRLLILGSADNCQPSQPSLKPFSCLTKAAKIKGALKNEKQYTKVQKKKISTQHQRKFSLLSCCCKWVISIDHQTLGSLLQARPRPRKKAPAFFCWPDLLFLSQDEENSVPLCFSDSSEV